MGKNLMMDTGFRLNPNWHWVYCPEGCCKILTEGRRFCPVCGHPMQEELPAEKEKVCYSKKCSCGLCS